MQFSVSRHGICHRGSYFHERYSLRITQRCREDNLGVSADTEFSNLQDHPIVKALVKDRQTDPDGGKTVGAAAGDKTLRRVGFGDDHRGVTWWDAENEVVWLCAYHGKHRAGADDDSFVYFDELIAAGRMYPTVADYEMLFEEEDLYFLDFVEQDAQESLEVARQNPDTEVEVLIGRAIGTTIVVEVVETLEETYVAFSWKQVENAGHLDNLLALLRGFYPDSRWEDWEMPGRLPTRELRDNEGCFKLFHG